MQKGVLYLIPTLLGEAPIDESWPEGHRKTVNNLKFFIVENLRSARRFLKLAGYQHPFDTVTFHLLNKHTDGDELTTFLNPARSGISIGLLSEAGCPCIADPGQLIVSQAHQMGIRVKPLVGPSSIMLALMASGMNGQAFQFHGYLPIQKQQRVRQVKELEKLAKQTGATQIFMETPFRNMQMLEDVLKSCRPDTLLCIAADLTTPDEYIRTQSIGDWTQQALPRLHKRPAIFLLFR